MLYSRYALRFLTVALSAIFASTVVLPRDAGAAPTLIIRVTGDAAHQSFRTAPATAQIRNAASIDEALALARRHRQADVNAAIIIDIAGGTYRLTEPLRLGRRDSGTARHPLVVRGAMDASTIIVGSVALAPAEVEAGVTHRSRLPKVALGKVATYHLPRQLAQEGRVDAARTHTDEAPPAVPFELFDGQGRLTPARWPNEGWARVAAASDDESSRSFSAIPDRLAAWAGEPDLWAGGYWKWDWSFETRPVAGIDPSASTITLDQPVTYGFTKDARYFVYHAMSELDRPGEWVRTPDRRSVLVWPQEGRASEVLEVSVAESLLILEDARNIRFENLTFARSRGDAIRVSGGSSIVIADCTVMLSGGRGIVFRQGMRSGVRHSTVVGTGAGGISLSGGDRQTLTPADLFVASSRIARFGRLGRTYQPAIRIRGVGNAAIGNFIAEGYHTAIHFAGNDHIIELNEITRVTTETSDAGVIYTGRDWTARGTRIRNNFLHDIGGENALETKGVYLDDMASGIFVEGNLFVRVEQPVFIGGGRDNVIERNIWIASEPGIHIDSRGTSWARSSVKNPDSELRRNLAAVPYRSADWRKRYPLLATILEDAPVAAKRNRSRLNGFVGTDLYRFEGDATAKLQILGPDIAVSPDRINSAGTLFDTASAREIGLSLSGAALPKLWPKLPFTRMDRGNEVPPPVQHPVN